MKPGRELDVLIAEKVMGWTKIQKQTYQFDLGDNEVVRLESSKMILGNSPNDWKETLRPIPNYSTSIPCAWDIVEKIISMGLMVDIQTYSKFHQVQLDKATHNEVPPYWTYGESISGETVPHAICLAAITLFGFDRVV